MHAKTDRVGLVQEMKHSEEKMNKITVRGGIVEDD